MKISLESKNWIISFDLIQVKQIVLSYDFPSWALKLSPSMFWQKLAKLSICLFYFYTTNKLEQIERFVFFYMTATDKFKFTDWSEINWMTGSIVIGSLWCLRPPPMLIRVKIINGYQWLQATIQLKPISTTLLFFIFVLGWIVCITWTKPVVVKVWNSVHQPDAGGA